jgi:hypothetical protein
LITRGLTFGDGQQGFNQIPTMIGMRGGTGGNHPGQITGDDNIGIGAADAALGSFTKRIQAAWSHDADTATETQLAKTAMRFLGLGPVPDGLDALLPGFFVHGHGVGLNGNLIDGDGVIYHK